MRAGAVPLLVTVTLLDDTLPVAVLANVTLVGDTLTDAMVPVPLRATVEALPVLSVTTRDAVFDPLVVGAKKTAISQPPPGATAAHVLDTILKCAAPVPVMVALAVRGEKPEFPTTTLSVGPVVPTFWLGKGIEGRSNVVTGRLEPVREMTRPVPGVLSVMVNDAEETTPARGVKATEIGQLLPETMPTTPVQPSVSAKSAAPGPLRATELTMALALPVLVYLTVLFGGVPATLPKDTAETSVLAAGPLGCTLPEMMKRLFSTQSAGL